MHTSNSKDARTPPNRVGELCKHANIDGLAVTDHNILSTITARESLVIIPGMEISSRDGHIIALGISNAIQRGLTADQTIRIIHDNGGVCIIPHPYDLLRSSVRPNRLSERPDAIEVINAASFLHTITWHKARKYALENKLPTTGGSDSHIPVTLGRAYTIIETSSSELSSILNAIRDGSTVPVGRPVRFYERLDKIVR